MSDGRSASGGRGRRARRRGGAPRAAPARSSRSRGRSSPPRPRRSSSSTRRPTSSSSRRWPARARTSSSAGAFPSGTGHRRLGARRRRQPLVIEDVDAATRASAARTRRGDRLRAEGADGRAAAPRGARARRARGARPAAALALQRSRRWSCSGCSRTRRRSRSTCCSEAATAQAVLDESWQGDIASSPAWRRHSTSSEEGKRGRGIEPARALEDVLTHEAGAAAPAPEKLYAVP